MAVWLKPKIGVSFPRLDALSGVPSLTPRFVSKILFMQVWLIMSSGAMGGYCAIFDCVASIWYLIDLQFKSSML